MNHPPEGNKIGLSLLDAIHLKKSAANLLRLNIKSFDAYIDRVNNHARSELDCLTNFALRLLNQRRNMVAVAQNDFAGNCQAVILVALEQVLDCDVFQTLDEFPRPDNSFDDGLNNFVVDN